MAPNEIFQYSIVNALMDGVADKGLPISTLLSHGDHGLGTFRHMVGEMIILNGDLYQMKSDGSITTVDPGSDAESQAGPITPFAMVTYFQPTHSIAAVLSDKADLVGILSFLLPDAHNLYLAIRIKGIFKSVTVRTAGGQTKPHESLVEVGKHQTSHVFDEGRLEGTIIGFRSPAYMQGISVAGDHLHFISADKKKGGHLLGLISDGEVTVEVAPISKFHLELPTHDGDFNDASLAGDSAAIAAVEG